MAPPLGFAPYLHRNIWRGLTPTFSPNSFHVSPVASLMRTNRMGKLSGRIVVPGGSTFSPGNASCLPSLLDLPFLFPFERLFGLAGEPSALRR